ncbi:hypothetical protein [Modicisalibacter ilicicola]|nr:hypothetical protein [Halomonas ilicicola]
MNDVSIPKHASSRRPDLSNGFLLGLAMLLVAACIAAAVAYAFDTASRPGDTPHQIAAMLGVVLLLGPLAFFLAKRMGYAASPPWWFAVHALGATLGAVAILFHASAGSFATPASIPLLLMLFLCIQGVLARVFLSRRLSFLFARSFQSFNFHEPLEIDRQALREVIERKEAQLETLDPVAQEATFSPRLRHFLTQPVAALRYQALMEKELRLVGARRRAGRTLSSWRRLHLLAAVLFYLGMLGHVVVMLFFAGYAAGEGEIYWWHLAAWGR